MQTCASCEGFLPPQAAACPHCDGAIEPKPERRLAKSAARVARNAAMMATLMACYGAGYYEEVPSPDGFCERAVELPADGFAEGDHVNRSSSSTVLSSSCSNGIEPETIYLFEPPPEDLGQPGTLTVAYQADDPVSVYVLDDCVDEAELACVSGDTSGSVVLELDALEPLFIVVDGETAYTIQVGFEPAPPP